MSLDERMIADLRRDIAEAHAIATRTHNAVATLAAALKDVVTRQDKYERGLNLNSFVAYLLFTVLLGGAFYLLYRSRAEHLLGDREEALHARADALEQASAAKKELEARDTGERKAQELWALLADGRRADLIARLPEISQVRLSPAEKQVLEQAAARARTEIVDAAFAAGVEAIRGQQWKKAGAELKRALTYEPDGPRAVQMRYYHGVALSKQGDNQEAIKELDAAIAGGVEKTVGADARYVLGLSLEESKQLDRARTEYLRFSEGHWNHPWAPSARRKAADIARSKAPGP